MSKVWMFYDADTKQQSKPLSSSASQKFIMKIKVKEIHNFFIWSPGWENWKPLLLFLQSRENTDFVSPVPALPAEATKTVKIVTVSGVSQTTPIEQSTSTPFDEKTSLSFTDVELTHTPKISPSDFYDNFSAEDIMSDSSIKKKKSKIKLERREDTRHNLKIEILIISPNGKSFRTHSKNISLGGTWVQDPIPREFFDKSFEIMILNKFEEGQKGKLILKGEILADASDPRRIIFKRLTIPVEKRLEELLKSYIEKQKTHRKKAV